MKIKSALAEHYIVSFIVTDFFSISFIIVSFLDAATLNTTTRVKFLLNKKDFITYVNNKTLKT